VPFYLCEGNWWKGQKLFSFSAAVAADSTPHSTTGWYITSLLNIFIYICVCCECVCACVSFTLPSGFRRVAELKRQNIQTRDTSKSRNWRVCGLRGLTWISELSVEGFVMCSRVQEGLFIFRLFISQTLLPSFFWVLIAWCVFSWKTHFYSTQQRWNKSSTLRHSWRRSPSLKKKEGLPGFFVLTAVRG
jgi:hypothetical protein